MLQMQQLICRRLGIQEIEADDEFTELSNVTAVETLANELENKIPMD
jgi:hypothetical protein